MDGSAETIRYPWAQPPDAGTATEVAPGVLWMRLALPMALDHVNIYALDDGDGWTVIDTGVHDRKALAQWQALLDGPLAGKPISRVVVTHSHPDHVGMAGWLMAHQGAELLMSRIAWLTARMLMLDVEEEPSPQARAFWRSAGMAAEVYQQRSARRPFNLSDIAYPLPVGYTRLRQGDRLRMGGRDWDVHVGHGHAPEHLTFWSRDDHLVLSGDQILPSISPNIGVSQTEPEADPLGEWLESCARLATLARADHLVLGGHKLPFVGLPLRMHQLAENHHSALRRLCKHLDQPRTAAECFIPLFKRQIEGDAYGLALAEAVAHLNHLHQTGTIRRRRRPDGAWLWQCGE